MGVSIFGLKKGPISMEKMPDCESGSWRSVRTMPEWLSGCPQPPGECLSGWIASAANPVECKQHYPDLIFLRSESMCVTFLEAFLFLIVYQVRFYVNLGFLLLSMQALGHILFLGWMQFHANIFVKGLWERNKSHAICLAKRLIDVWANGNSLSLGLLHHTLWF